MFYINFKTLDGLNGIYLAPTRFQANCYVISLLKAVPILVVFYIPYMKSYLLIGSYCLPFKMNDSLPCHFCASAIYIFTCPL